jgi:hypothetical protein
MNIRSFLFAMLIMSLVFVAAPIASAEYSVLYPRIDPNLVTLPDSRLGGAPLPTPHSGNHSWWYGQETTGTYIGVFDPTIQTPKNGGLSVAPNNGTLDTPVIDLTGVSSANLTFWTWWEIESVQPHEFNQLFIDISLDGGAFINVGSLSPNANPTWRRPDLPYASGYGKTPPALYPNTPPIWVKETFNLSNYTGHNVQIRFRFQTNDPLYNGFRGWFIDDIAVTGDDSPIFSDDVENGTNGFSATGFWHIFPSVKVPTLTPSGIAALAGVLALVAVVTMRRRL